MVLALATGTPAGAAVGGTVDAGALRATVRASPFAIDFTEPGGRTVARETALRAGIGQATAVVDERRDGAAYVATLATDAGGRLQLRVEPDGDGIVRVEVSG